MSKKKRSKNPAESNQTETKDKRPLAKKKWKTAIAVCLLLGVVLSAYLLYQNNTEQAKGKILGGVASCQLVPPFVRALGFGNNAVFSTSDRKIPGLVLIEGSRVYQHPSWKLAGSLAPITRDAKGNTYVGPAPWIDLVENKPDDQNKIYRVDRQSQVMAQFCDLPKAAAPSSQNPYGVLGLSFDCETSSLYVSSIAGSTRNEMQGRLFQVSLDGKVLSQLDNTDAIGLAVFNTPKGKRLYFGQARNSEIWSIALNDDGNFTGETRKEFSLENLGPRGDDKARRINFTQQEMTVFGIEFSFNLIAPTERPQTMYRFRYDTANDSWRYVEEPPQIVGES